MKEWKHSKWGKSIFKTRKSLFTFIQFYMHIQLFRALPVVLFCMHVCLPSLTAVKMPSRRSFLTFCFQMKETCCQKMNQNNSLKVKKGFPNSSQQSYVCICSSWSKGIYLKCAFENLSKFLQRFRKKEKKSLLKWTVE